MTRPARDLGNVLLTGAAGLVGAEVLRELLNRPDTRSIRVLVPTDEGWRRRLLARLEAHLGELPPEVGTVAGDLWRPRFGRSPAEWEALAGSIDTAFHCAQRESRDRNLAAARRANVRPVESWLQLLGLHPELRLHHLSTVFVGGRRRGLFTEFDLDCGQDFHDAWERSQHEAETRLRDSPNSDRVAIYRPSHTLGRSGDGAAIEHGGAYALVASLAAAAVLPGDGRAAIDFVPADYVAAAMVALAVSGARGTYHLVRGWRAPLPVREAARLAARGRSRSRGPRLLPRALAWPLWPAGAAALGAVSRWRAFSTARDLLHQGPAFDDFRARAALAPLGIECPAPLEWLEKAVRAAETRGWEAPPAGGLSAPAKREARPAIVAAPVDPRLQVKRFHQIGDVKLAYRDLGKGDPIVFFHGFAGAHSWDGVVERVVGRHRAIIVDTLGLADSEGPLSADFHLPAQAARVRGLLSALEIPAAHVVGNDTGGVIAQFFAVRWPHLVKSLVLSDCDAHGVWPPTHVKWMARGMRIPGGTRFLTAIMKIPAVARSQIGFGRMVFDKGLLTRGRLARYLDPVASTRARRMRLKRFFHSFDAKDLAQMNSLLGRLNVATMVVWGGDNAYWSPSWGKTLYEAIPGARRFELIPFAGISCHEERPDHFARLLLGFIDKVEQEV